MKHAISAIWVAVAGFIGVLLIGACATSPTGRKQFILFSDSEVAQQGVAAFAEIKKKEKPEPDAATSNYVMCVARAVTAQSGRGSWEIVTFHNDEANAFALPGGKIGVYSGLLKYAKNQDQLAAVLGHEVAHVLARHGAERISQQFGAEVGMAAVQAAVGEDKNKQWVLYGALGVAQFGVLLPFSRDHESEADKMGVDLMARAGFDPNQSIDLWRNMAAGGGGQPPEWMSTHPSHETRITNLKSWAPAAMPAYTAAVARGRRPKCQM